MFFKKYDNKIEIPPAVGFGISWLLLFVGTSKKSEYFTKSFSILYEQIKEIAIVIKNNISSI